MWNQINERYAMDEHVSDGTNYHNKTPFTHHSSRFSHSGQSDSNMVYPTYPTSQTKDRMFDSKCNTKESDSGFLSDMGIQEEPLLDSDKIVRDCLVSDKSNQSSSILINKTKFSSDSGLDLEVSSEDQNLKSHQIDQNNLNTSQQTQTRNQLRNIALSDLLRPDEDGDTTLHLAVLQGFIEVVFSLVRIISDPSLLEIPNNKLQTPLHLAVLTNQAPLVRRLVVGGSSVLLRDGHGNTPLHLACRNGFFECAKALCIPITQDERQAALLHGAIPPQPLPQDLESRNYDGQMPLHLAAMNGHGQIAKLLCCFGANVNAIEGKFGRTALHYAVERRHPALLHFLITQCNAVIEAETYSGYTAFQLATASAPMLAGLLVNLGAKHHPQLSSDGEESEDSASEELFDCSPKKEKVFS